MIIELTNTIANASLQIGDTAYYVPTSGQYASGDPILLGEIIDVNLNWIEVDSTNTLSSGDFIMFSKNKVVNDSGVTGYYADVKLTNESTDKIELFALSSEVSESSK
jgi:predicted RecA/RadA family phage recombinase